MTKDMIIRNSYDRLPEPSENASEYGDKKDYLAGSENACHVHSDAGKVQR